MTNTERPIWKTYPEFDFIEVNQFGEIRTVDRIVTYKNGGKHFYKGRVLKQHLLPNGYLFVHVNVNGKQFILYVHRAVATCFIPNPDNLPEVNHIDNDPTNNAISNLEWCSHEYNITYREKCGKSAAEVSGRPVIAVNSETSEVFWFKSRREASRQLGASQGNVSMVIIGKRNTTGGCWFTNADENAVERTREKFGDNIAKKVERMMNCN